MASSRNDNVIITKGYGLDVIITYLFNAIFDMLDPQFHFLTI